MITGSLTGTLTGISSPSSYYLLKAYMTKLTKAVPIHTPKVATDVSAYTGKITVLKPSLKGMPMKARAIVRFRNSRRSS